MLVVVPLLVNEAGDCAPGLARWLLRWGARRLGQPGRTRRYEEEWLADLDRIPGKITKLAHSCGVVTMSVPRLRAQFRRGRHRAPHCRMLSARKAGWTGAEVACSQQVDAMLSQVSQMLVPQFADHCFIDVAHGDTFVRRMQRHVDGWTPPAGTWAQTGEQIHFPAGHFCRQAIERLETVLFADVTPEEFPSPSAMSEGLSRKMRVASVLVAPIYTRGMLLGVISVARSGLTSSTRPRYTTSDRDQFAVVARKVSASIDSMTLSRAIPESVLTRTGPSPVRD